MAYKSVDRISKPASLRRAAWLVGLVSALLLGCSSSPKPTGISHTELPPPDPTANAALQQQDYRIGPLDGLEITVYPVAELNRAVQVDAAGTIDFPLIGNIKAATKTPRELGREIASKLGEKDLESPQVSVVVKQAISQRFTVEGAVGKPGVYEMTGRLSMLQAIATASGVDQIANPKDIVIFRTVNQQRMAALVDLPAVRAGKVNDPQIYPGDTIVVPTSGSRKALRDIIGLTPLTTFLLPFGL